MTTGDPHANVANAAMAASRQSAMMNSALGVGTITGTYAPQQQEMWDYPEYRITVHKARNGMVVRIMFSPMNSRSEVPRNELWLVPEGGNVHEVIAAALASNALEGR